MQERAERAGAKPHSSNLELIADMIRTESHFHFPEGYTLSRAVDELVEQRPRFCEALRWLCSPKTVSPHNEEALVAKGVSSWGRYPEIDANSELFVAYFEDHGVKHFRRHLYLSRGRLLSTWLPEHVIDLFCVFVLAECGGKEPPLMPFKFCARCNKLVFTTLQGEALSKKTFCSDKCQQRSHWSKTPEARNDFGFVERLWEKNIPERLKRLAKPEVQERLNRIRRDWSHWHALTRMLAKIDAQTRVKT
jgi:hypothetical protein